jgi:hypothetical protein
MAGTSGKSVVQKLGLKPGFCIFVDGLSGAYDGDIKVCAVDEVWSGLKFVIPVKDRGKAPT